MRNSPCGQIGLVIEYAPKVVFIREDFGLEGEECTAAIDKVNAGEVVFESDFLGAEVFFDGDGEVGSAFDGGIVGDDYALAVVDASDPGDDTCSRGGGIVHVMGGEGGKFKEWCTGIEEGIDAFAGEELASFFVFGNVFWATALKGCREILAVGCHDFIHGGAVCFMSIVAHVNLGWDYFHLPGLMLLGVVGSEGN